MTFASMSDVGGVGSTTEELEGSLGAWLVLPVDGMLTSRRTVRVNPISWRSVKLKRKVSSTFAGETPALSQAVAEGTSWSETWQCASNPGRCPVRCTAATRL